MIKKILFIFLIASSVYAQPSILPLVYPANMVYVGSARVPRIGTIDADGFNYGGRSLFYTIRKTFFLGGYENYNKFAELNLPTTWVKGPVTSLPVMSLRQPMTNITEGKLALLNPGDPNAKLVGGLIEYQNYIYTGNYAYYDGGERQVLTHLRMSNDFSVTGEVLGPIQVGASPWKARMVGGYETLIPSEWQSLLGGPVLTGNCCLAVVGNTSSGPSIGVFNPNDLGNKNPVPGIPLFYYPLSNPIAGGGWGITSNIYNGSSQIRGVIFPSGTRSILFFGRQGIGKFCYGAGTNNQALDGTLTPDGVTKYCYDPVNSGKGTHAYPYVYQVWAFDANDGLAVKNGQIKPWQVKPYLIWQMTFPYSPTFGNVNLDGAAYDDANKMIYLSQAFADGTRPVIHAYKLIF